MFPRINGSIKDNFISGDGSSGISTKTHEFGIIPSNCSVCCVIDHESTFGPKHNNSYLQDPLQPDKDDLFTCLKHFLRFGKVIGVVPLGGVFGVDSGGLTFRWKSLSAAFSVGVLLLLVLNLGVGFLGVMKFSATNATEWAWSAESFVFYSMGVYTYIYFLLKGTKLISIFENWKHIELVFRKTDDNLFRDINAIAGLIYTSAILENILLQIIFLFVDLDSAILGKPPLERYFLKAQTNWSTFVPYHETIAILIFFTNKFALYAWNFVDILTILLSRGIYYKFKMLHQLAAKRLLDLQGPCGDPNFWKNIIKDHEALCKLLSKFEDFLSPLIFASYAINCFYVCLQLHLGLTAQQNNTNMQRIYAVWSFAHLVVRVFTVSLTAAKINDHATAILEVLYNCPDSCETKEMERARFKLSSRKIGLSGLGCFIITRPFILRIVSVIFTFEIVLLQAPGPGSASGKKGCIK